MKRLWLILLMCLIATPLVWAEPTGECEKKEAKKEIVQQCPKTLMTESCLACHIIPSFTLKEVAPDATLSYPNFNMKIIKNVGYYLLEDINDSQIADFFNYITWHPEVKSVVFEIQSPGGSMFKAWRIVGLMDLYKSRGYVIETRMHGFAASAGFLIFANGSKGHRFATPTGEMMWHELISFKMFDFSGPADKEDEAQVLRHLQDTANNWLVARSNLTKDEWDVKIRKKEFWMNGAQAVEYGIADGVPK